MDGLDNYRNWCKENAGKYWVPTEPCEYTFATSPWEGEISVDNVGKIVQYLGGEWQPFVPNQDK